MKELKVKTIDQITPLRYLTETDLIDNKGALRCLNVIAREHG